MKSPLSLIILAVFILVMPSVKAYAKMEEAPDTARDFPRLLWQMSDVPPHCLAMLYPAGAVAPSFVPLPTCGQDEKGQVYEFAQEGFGLTTNYPHGSDEPSAGFIAYHVVGEVADGNVIETLWNGGGTGLYSGVAVVKIDGDKLSSVHTFDGGDRCNGGVHVSRIEGGKVVVENNITPGDFTTIAYGDDRDIKAYDDVMASAASCVGQSLSVDGNVTQIILSPEALTDRISDREAAVYPLQRCFNDHFTRQAKISTVMTMPAFRAFMDELLADCIPAKTF